jgi:hypothetical protein
MFMPRKLRVQYPGAICHVMSREALQAEQALRRERRRRGWKQAELLKGRNGDPEKVRLAWPVRQQTPMRLK